MGGQLHALMRSHDLSAIVQDSYVILIYRGKIVKSPRILVSLLDIDLTSEYSNALKVAMN